MELEEKRRARYLLFPSLGALLFTQGWTLGARLYLLFLLSLVPFVGIGVLVVCFLFGRRLSWKFGNWRSWEDYQKWMKILDLVGVIWIIGLIIFYFIFKKPV